MSDTFYCAYYFSLKSTGVKEIDNLLMSVAEAGKSFHHTNQWNDSVDWLNDGKTYQEIIQETADKSAKEIQSLRQRVEELEGALQDMSREAVLLLNHAENSPWEPNCAGPPLWLLDCRDRITKARAALEE